MVNWYMALAGCLWYKGRNGRHKKHLKQRYAKEIKPQQKFTYGSTVILFDLPTPIITTRRHRVSKEKDKSKGSEHQIKEIGIQKENAYLTKRKCCIEIGSTFATLVFNMESSIDYERRRTNDYIRSYCNINASE